MVDIRLVLMLPTLVTMASGFMDTEQDSVTMADGPICLITSLDRTYPWVTFASYKNAEVRTPTNIDLILTLYNIVLTSLTYT